MPEGVIATLERAKGIALPDEYREFLLRIGNGGNGPPYYGLARVGEVADDMTNAEQEIFSSLSRVARPFPFTQTWCWEEDEICREGTSEQVYDGSIYLGNDGCGQYWLLIVTGAERGKVWMICGEGICPTSPKRDFLTWMEDWLDGVESWWDK